jgi:hypothetical protein
MRKAEPSQAVRSPVDDLGVGVRDPKGSSIAPLGIEYAGQESLGPLG